MDEEHPHDRPDGRLRSRRWFDDPHDPGMTALYLERYMNFGLSRDELQSGKPIIGIAQTGSDLSPCNRHHMFLAERVREGIRDAGGIPLEFPVHPIQETGKRPTAALDRNLAYLGLVEVLHGYPLDGVVLTTGCDKTTPACLMAAATVNIPAIVLSGGPMLDGWYKGRLSGSGTIVWEGRKLHAEGKIDYKQFMEMVASSAPSAGHCNTMGTALSMNSLAEALGMSLPGCAAIPAPYRDRQQMSWETGKRIVAMVHENLRPSDIMTKEAFENAVVAAAALGASSNCPIHMVAIARHMGVEHTLEDWQRLGPDVPLLVDCQPAGRFLGEAFHRAGGVQAVMKELADAGSLHTDVRTVSGRTLAGDLELAPPADREVIRAYAHAAQGAGRLRRDDRQPVRHRGHEDQRDRRRVPRPLPVRPRAPRRLRRPRHRVRGPRGLPRPHRGPGARHRRALHPRHPQLRPGRLSGRCRGGEHAAARRPAEARHQRAAHHGRRAAERHLRLALHPQRLARGGGGRRPRAAAHRRPGARGPQHPPGGRAAARRRSSPRRRSAWDPPTLDHKTPWEEIYRASVGQQGTGACLEMATQYQDIITTRGESRNNH